MSAAKTKTASPNCGRGQAGAVGKSGPRAACGSRGGACTVAAHVSPLPPTHLGLGVDEAAIEVEGAVEDLRGGQGSCSEERTCGRTQREAGTELSKAGRASGHSCTPAADGMQPHNGRDDERPAEGSDANACLGSRLGGTLVSKCGCRQQQAAERRRGRRLRLRPRLLHPLLLLLQRPLLRQAPAGNVGHAWRNQACARRARCVAWRHAVTSLAACPGDFTKHTHLLPSTHTRKRHWMGSRNRGSRPARAGAAPAPARRASACPAPPAAHLMAARLELQPTRAAPRAGSCTARRAAVACIVGGPDGAFVSRDGVIECSRDCPRVLALNGNAGSRIAWELSHLSLGSHLTAEQAPAPLRDHPSLLAQRPAHRFSQAAGAVYHKLCRRAGRLWPSRVGGEALMAAMCVCRAV